MPAGHGFGLVHHLLVRLDVRISRAFLAAVRTARVEHELGQIEIALIAGLPIKLGEPHLDDLVTGPDGLLSGAESLVEQIGGAQCDIQQRALTRGLVMRDGRFIEMPEIVQFVAVDSLQNPALRAGPRVRMRGIDGAGGVEISVLLLRRADLFDESVDVSFELGIGINTERVGRALDHFINVGVVEWIRRIFVILKWLAAQRLGSANEVVDAPGLFVFLECERNGDFAIDLDARRPESVVDVDGGEGNRLNRIVTGLRPTGREEVE